MAAAENLTIAHRVDENMILVGENVEGINDRLQIVHTNIHGVSNEVGLINQGELFFYPQLVLSFTGLGVMEATAEIQLVSKQVGDLHRS